MEVDQKALEINLTSDIYGTFAEIGAGQETARHFFQAGGSAGTIAKTMSAYDKTYSDEIYGAEPSGRYVGEQRLLKMLDHEFGLLINRLGDERKDTRFFAFANTVAAINYTRTISGHGWLGLRFQTIPGGPHNDLILHARLLDPDNRLQQEAVGKLGVNLIYGCFFYPHNMDAFVKSLIDGLEGRVSVDMIRLQGEDFNDTDNKSLSFKLVNYGLAEVAMFGPDGQNLHPSEFMYRKPVLSVRGAFKPITWMNYDIIRSASSQFRSTHHIAESDLVILAEITLDILSKDHEPDEQDFLERAEMLSHLGFVVCLSARGRQHTLIRYLEEYKPPVIGIVLTVGYLARYIDQMIDEYREYGLLQAFARIFTGRVRMYVYPSRLPGTIQVMTAGDIEMDEHLKYLYKFLLSTRQIVDIDCYDPAVLKISATRVLNMIRAGQAGWEDFLPENIVSLIKEKSLLGYHSIE